MNIADKITCMAVRTNKRVKSKDKNISKLPLHVKTSANQLEKMQAIIKNLLSPLADRFQFFELPRSKSSKKKS